MSTLTLLRYNPTSTVVPKITDVSNLIEHGLAGLVYSEWRDKLPSHGYEPLKGSWQIQFTVNSLYERELIWIDEVCRQLNLKVTVLKGAALLTEIYEDPGCRSMGDVDLLVNPHQWDLWQKIFIEKGYTLVPSTRWEANCFKLNFSRWFDGIELVFELHQKLFYGEPAEISWRSEPLTAGGALQKLAPEDMLVHLMGHLAYQHTFLKLSWLVDIDRFIRKHETTLNWDRISTLTNQLRHQRSTSAVLWAAQHYFQTPIAIDVIARFGKFNIIFWNILLTRTFIWSPTRNRVRYYLLKHLVKDRIGDALIYDFLWVWRRAWR